MFIKIQLSKESNTLIKYIITLMVRMWLIEIHNLSFKTFSLCQNDGHKLLDPDCAISSALNLTVTLAVWVYTPPS